MEGMRRLDLLSLVLVAYPAYLFFRARTHVVLAFAGCGIWVLWAVLFRSLLLTVLGAI